MATEKHRVATYLPRDLSAAFRQYCASEGQSHSAALLQIVRTHLAAWESTGEPKSELLSLVKNLDSRLKVLESRIEEDIEEDIF